MVRTFKAALLCTLLGSVFGFSEPNRSPSPKMSAYCDKCADECGDIFHDRFCRKCKSVCEE